MRKVKFLSNYYEETLEEMVNAFISTHTVTDIQFQASGGSTKIFAVMIVYEELLGV